MKKTKNKIKVKVITLFPELIRNYLQDALIAKALGLEVLTVDLVNLRDFSDNPYKSVDDAPYGGGDGMLIRPDILEKAYLSIRNESIDQYVIYFTPQGKLLDQNFVQRFFDLDNPPDAEIILICGRYAGIDQRFIDLYVDQEISIGNYVLSGGELPALVLIEAISRYIPGVLGNLDSVNEDTFKNNMLEAPQYTRPQIWNELEVPEILLSGNHAKIAEWKKTMSVQMTLKKRPDLIKK